MGAGVVEDGGRRWGRLAAAGVGVLVLLAPLQWLPWVPATLLAREFRNFGHFPLFAAITLLLYVASRAAFGARWSPLGHVAAAFAGAVALGLGSEIEQYFGPRDAAFDDLARDVVAAACVLVWVAARRPPLDRYAALGFLLRAATVAAALLAAVPVLLQADAERARDARFPVLAGFESADELRFVLTRGAALDLGPAPAGWGRQGTVGHARYAALDYPQVTLREPVADWRGFARLCVDLYAELDDEVTVVLAVNDAGWSGEPGDRFRTRITLGRGEQRICVDLDDVRAAPVGRELRLDLVRSLNLFGALPSHPFEFWLDDLRLEPPAPPTRAGAPG